MIGRAKRPKEPSGHLAGAFVGAPVVVALLGALIGAVQDCSSDGYRTVALLTLTGAAAAAWWVRRVRAQCG